jgi:hypothetical protein
MKHTRAAYLSLLSAGAWLRAMTFSLQSPALRTKWVILLAIIAKYSMMRSNFLCF